MIADRTPPVAPEVTLLATEASAAVTRFDAELGREIAPFASILLRSESASSSQIENLSSGAKQIALAELGSREKRNATAVVGNVAAMEAAIALADQRDPESILAMHRALLEGTEPDIAGRWRTGPVWIGGTGVGPHGADYVAPVAERVPALIDDLVAFTGRADILPLVSAAVTHAQFETIHPFPDGNGRTGRALVQAMFRSSGLTRNVTVPVSAGLLADTGRYFATLEAYRRGDVTPIVEVMANAALSAVANGSRLVADLRSVNAAWNERVGVRRGTAARRLLDVLLRQPVIDARTTAVELGIAPGNVGRAIAPLVDAGILCEFTGFGRNRMWHAKEVTDALDEFAARAIRRG
ncbi:Fic family protein [Tsukamurella soli]|uniref:Fic family protein n=2 Tax=Tsukamurella soli TaxID=644556 RepID=A0ABP8K766_9ACTN